MAKYYKRKLLLLPKKLKIDSFYASNVGWPNFLREIICHFRIYVAKVNPLMLLQQRSGFNENEESVLELKHMIGFNVSLNHVSDLKELSLSMNNSKLYGLLHDVQKIIETETINNKKSLRQTAINRYCVISYY